MKKTKSALMLSALSMLLCAAMLVGTTFAWFTDSASTGVNKIQAGNLDIGFKYWDGTDYVDVTDQTKVFKDDALWEPGHVEVAYLKISNNGNLALKYALGTNNVQDYGTSVQVGEKPIPGFPNMMQPVYETIKLSDYIKFAVIPMADENARFATREDALAAANADSAKVTGLNGIGCSGNLGVEEEAYVAVMAFMPETVGNEINYPKLNSIRFGIAITATQDTVENDSFGNDYDANASANIATNGAEWDVLYKNPNVTSAMITEDMARTSQLDVPGRDFNLQIANGATVSNTSNSTHNVINVSGVGNKVTITGGTVECNGTGHAIRVDQNGGTTTIKDGHFIGNGASCIFVSSGTVIIEGGMFECKEKALDSVDNTLKYFVLNTYNSTTMPRNIVVKGGTFVNYNPADGDNVDKVSFVASGFKVVSEMKDNGDIWYTVVPE